MCLYQCWLVGLWVSIKLSQTIMLSISDVLSLCFVYGCDCCVCHPIIYSHFLVCVISLCYVCAASTRWSTRAPSSPAWTTYRYVIRYKYIYIYIYYIPQRNCFLHMTALSRESNECLSAGGALSAIYYSFTPYDPCAVSTIPLRNWSVYMPALRVQMHKFDLIYICS